MAGSEYIQNIFSDLSQRLFVLEPFAEYDEAVAMEKVNPNLLQKPRSHVSQSPRMQRLHYFLPSLYIHRENSKLSKDTQLPQLPRKPAPIQKDAAPNQPPSRDAPSAPVSNDGMPPPPKRKLQKSDSPNRLKPLPNPRSGSPARPETSSATETRSRRNSLLPSAPGAQGRSVSSPINSRPTSAYVSGDDGSDPASGSKLRRKSFLFGGKRSRHASQEIEVQGTGAWVSAGSGKIDYQLSLLTNGEKVPELWDDNADTFVYLFPQASGRGPSFKVPSMTLSSSHILLNYMNSSSPVGRARGGSFDGRHRLSVEDATRNLSLGGPGTPPYTPTKTSMSDTRSSSDGHAESFQSFPEGPREFHLYFPTGLTSDGSHLFAEDVQILVDIRNLFAFLTGQPLVGTQQCPSTFRIFMKIGFMLSKFDFCNFDHTTFGESASASFDFYLDDLRMLDVRSSREKTIEGIILGEAMRSSELYTEAFTHAVGKYSFIMQMDYPIFKEISPATKTRLERAHQELLGRQQAASLTLTDFNFPSIFAGIAASTMSEESKYVRFKAWKSNFMSMRKHFISYCKDVHGQWPPKPNAKKGVSGGLNRMVLKALYVDMCSLYDLRADRESITTRSLDSDDSQVSNVSPSSTALRKLLTELDRSSPPIKPPIPFDVPMLPSMAAIDPTFNRLSPKDQHKASTKRLRSHEIALILSKTHNADCNYNTPFLNMYKTFEEKEAKGKNVQELTDMIYGHWIFMYAVIQSLPMLVVDAKGLRHTGSVEYFLCMSPQGRPWIEDPAEALYRVHGGGVVSLPAHLVEFGPEAVYRRSHCWTIAEQWLLKSEGGFVEGGNEQPSFLPEMLSPLAPPPGFGGGDLDMGSPFGGSPAGSPILSPADSGRSMSGTFSPPQLDPERRSRSRQAQRQSIALGLERLPIPVHPGSRPVSRGQSPGA
ncbi:hypothetical protein LSUE1_G008924, partial [Lachnellula suecica]